MVSFFTIGQFYPYFASFAFIEYLMYIELDRMFIYSTTELQHVINNEMPMY